MAGRPKLSDEEKARRAKEREEAKAAGTEDGRATRRSPLQMAIASTASFIEAMVGLEAYRGRRGLFEAEEYIDLCELNDGLHWAITHASREHVAINPQVEAMAVKANMQARIAELEAQLAASQEKLRVTGNSYEISPSEIPKDAMAWNKRKGWVDKTAKPATKARKAEIEENAA